MEIQVLICLLATAWGVAAFDPPSPPPSNLHLVNVSIGRLDSNYVLHLNPYLGSLKISRSKIDEIDERALDPLLHLNLLEISDCHLSKDIKPQTFSRLPALEILVLRNLGLRRADLQLVGVQEAILAENELETLDGISGGNLNYLDVSNNKLKVLRDSLEGLKKLSMIDISKNAIAEIGDVFGKNRNLLRILASENRIQSTAGLRLPWLKTLDLFDNRITILDSESFAKMEALEELVVAFNYIKKLEDPFKDLMELKFLNLAWNRVEEIAPALFRNNPYLSKLSLQGNKLKSLDRFQGSHFHLTHMDLSHNEIAFIDDEFFLSTPSIQVLDLSFNRLKAISDTFGPLTDLRILNLAFNNVTLAGYEFSKNHQLTRVNLSSNALQTSAALFKNNPRLTHLDVSHNRITEWCHGKTELKSLLKINLRGNHIRDLTCLGEKEFGALCEVDLRNNPLTCGKALDSVILELANRMGAPYRLTSESSDLVHTQCESLSLNISFNLWNSVKRDLCPKGQDLEIVREDSDPEETQDSSEAEEVVQDVEQHIVLPLGVINLPLKDIETGENPQSERNSWEEIDRRHDLVLNDLEDDEAPFFRFREHWHLYAFGIVCLVLIVVSLRLFHCFVRKHCRKAAASSPQKYVILHNEVYRITTEPTRTEPEGEDPTKPSEGDWVISNSTRNKLFSAERMKGLLNFGLWKKEGDSDSVQNILITSPKDGNSHNC